MKKILCLFLSIFMIWGCFTSCKKEDEPEKISLLVSKMYGTIKPVDIYKIKDGAMENWADERHVTLEKRYNYCVNNYTPSKASQKYDVSLLKVDMKKLELSIWDSNLNKPGSGLTPSKYRVYYSEYFGSKSRVSFVANVSFYQTMHIKLEEKADTYKITYYGQENSGIYGVYILFNNINGLENYKNIIEVPKSDITKIEYIV